MQDCRGCELYQDATQAVMGDGRVSAELNLVKPRGVVLLGATAGKAVHGSGFRVGTARGALQPWPETLPLPRPPAWTLATAHPSSVLRSRDREEDHAALVADLRVAAAALDQPRQPARQERP